MASESGSTVSIDLPGELGDWLDEQTERLEIDREQLLLQLIASYRTATELDDGAVGSFDEGVGIRIDEELDQRIQSAVESELSEATSAVQRRLTSRIDTVEAEFDEKITDVRERVVQLKQEADRKAPADHSHEELAAIDVLEARLDEMEADTEEFRSEFDELVPEHDERLEAVDDRLEQLEERMQTVAWVVSDLRDAYESRGGLETVERIKRAAAKENIERADCENCGNSVTISLLTDPECPHCNATVSNVEPKSGWFGSPKLRTASQLEPGEKP